MTTSPTTSSTPSSLRNSTGILPDLSLFGVVLIWGINLPVMKIGLEHMDVYAFNAFRLLISAVVLVLIALQNRSRTNFSFSAKTKWEILQYAFLASGLYQVLFLLGIAHTTAGNASLIMSTVPMWTALLAMIFLKERLSRLAWTGLFVALIGTLIVTAQNGLSGNPEHLLGNVIMVTAALVWSCGTVKSRQLLNEISPLTLSAISSVLMLPLHFGISAGSLGEGWSVLPQSSVWIPLLYSGILSTGVALVLWNIGVRAVGASHAAVYQNLTPAIAFVSAWFIRGETVSSIQMLGGVLIIGGLIIMRQARSLQLKLEQRLAPLPVAAEPLPAVMTLPDNQTLLAVETLPPDETVSAIETLSVIETVSAVEVAMNEQPLAEMGATQHITSELEIAETGIEKDGILEKCVGTKPVCCES